MARAQQFEHVGGCAFPLDEDGAMTEGLKLTRVGNEDR